MNAPGWFAAAGAAFMAGIATLMLLRFRNMWRWSKDNPDKMDDEWDPFGP
jgi:hypothetical protein